VTTLNGRRAWSLVLGMVLGESGLVKRHLSIGRDRGVVVLACVFYAKRWGLPRGGSAYEFRTIDAVSMRNLTRNRVLSSLSVSAVLRSSYRIERIRDTTHPTHRRCRMHTIPMETSHSHSLIHLSLPDFPVPRHGVSAIPVLLLLILHSNSSSSFDFDWSLCRTR
jgi:hypothetical protein